MLKRAIALSFAAILSLTAMEQQQQPNHIIYIEIDPEKYDCEELLHKHCSLINDPTIKDRITHQPTFGQRITELADNFASRFNAEENDDKTTHQVTAVTKTVEYEGKVYKKISMKHTKKRSDSSSEDIVGLDLCEDDFIDFRSYFSVKQILTQKEYTEIKVRNAETQYKQRMHDYTEKLVCGTK